MIIARRVILIFVEAVILFCTFVAVSLASDSALPTHVFDPRLTVRAKVLRRTDAGFVYLLCRANSKDMWVAVTQTDAVPGDIIDILKTQPFLNFQSKPLNKSFDEIYFPPAVKVVDLEKEKFDYRRQKGEIPDEDRSLQERKGYDVSTGAFKGEDESGTIVFTDDPSKLPKKKK